MSFAQGPEKGGGKAVDSGASDAQGVADNVVFRPSEMDSRTIFLSDLHRDVTEADLRSAVESGLPGCVITRARFVTSDSSDASLGFNNHAYIEFSTPENAQEGIKFFNHRKFNGVECRATYYVTNRDVLKGEKGGNVFVKDLPVSFGGKELDDLFSQCGRIISSKIATDSDGVSKRFGFVQFATVEESERAIKELNGRVIGGSRIVVVPHVSKNQRSPVDVRYTNVFVSPLPKEFTVDDFDKLFKDYGTITSRFIREDSDPMFGCVNFRSHEDAVRCIGEMNGREIDFSTIIKKPEVGNDGEQATGEEDEVAEKLNAIKLEEGSGDGGNMIYKITVTRARDKSEVASLYKQQLRERSVLEKINRMYSFQTIYLKNIGDDVKEEAIRAYFNKCYGQVVSCKVLKDPKGVTRNFGFVEMSTAGGAEKALEHINECFRNEVGHVLGKCLFATHAERKADRENRLKNIFNNMTERKSVHVETGDIVRGHSHEDVGTKRPFVHGSSGGHGSMPALTISGKDVIVIRDLVGSMFGFFNNAVAMMGAQGQGGATRQTGGDQGRGGRAYGGDQVRDAHFNANFQGARQSEGDSVPSEGDRRAAEWLIKVMVEDMYPKMSGEGRMTIIGVLIKNINPTWIGSIGSEVSKLTRGIESVRKRVMGQQE